MHFEKFKIQRGKSQCCGKDNERDRAKGGVIQEKKKGEQTTDEDQEV